ncbi:hypothetical protein FRC12_008730 [Ceratobasidium sp. 428]|nr:hypothetical protein FRC12_008730 [Ceratobasidium sp. 428]
MSPSGAALRVTTSDKEFKTRLNIVASAIQAFAPVCHIPFETDPSRANYSLVQLWVRRLFEVIYPATGTFEQFASTHQGHYCYPGVQKCMRQCLIEVTSSTDLSTFVIVNSLVAQLRLQDFDIDTTRPVSDALPENRLLEKYMVDAFFNLDEIDGLSVVNLGLREIVQSSQEPLDAIVLVHLIEAITCEMVYHSHAAYSVSQNRFSGLILPYSWARLLAKQYADSETVRDTSSLEIFLEVVSTISDGLDERHNSEFCNYSTTLSW